VTTSKEKGTKRNTKKKSSEQFHTLKKPYMLNGDSEDDFQEIWNKYSHEALQDTQTDSGTPKGQTYRRHWQKCQEF